MDGESDDKEQHDAKITVMKIKNFEALKINEVLGTLKEKLEPQQHQSENEDKSHEQVLGGILCKFEGETEHKDNENCYYRAVCNVRTTRPFDEVNDDINHGKITFYYWECSNGIKVYATIQSKMSNAWTKLSGLRDTKFPKAFAMMFLDSRQIKEIRALFLVGRNIGETTMRYADFDTFHESDIMRKYGVVKQFQGNVRTDGCGEKLRKTCQITDTDMLVNIQIGQVTLLRTGHKKSELSELCYQLLKLIDTSINSIADIAKNSEWNFLTYIKCLFGTEKLNEQLQKEFLEDYRRTKGSGSQFNLDNYLVHETQSVFDAAEISLKYKTSSIKWNCGRKKIRGREITVRKVMDSVSKRVGEEEPDPKDIKLKYFNYITNDTETRSLQDFLIVHLQIKDMKDDDEDDTEDVVRTKSHFKYGRNWYKVDNDLHLQTLKLFISAVKDTLITQELNGDDQPNIIPWCTSSDSKNPPRVTPIKLLKYTSDSVDFDNPSEQVKQDIKKLMEALTTKSSIFTSERNNLLSQNDKVNQHDYQLLDANLYVLPQSTLGKAILKHSGMDKSAEKVQISFINKIQRCLQESSNQEEFKNNVFKHQNGEKLDKLIKKMPAELSPNDINNFASLIKFDKDKKKDVCEKIKHILKNEKENLKDSFLELAKAEDKMIKDITEDMSAPFCNLKKSNKGTDEYLILYPNLTKSTWNEIDNLKLGICPIRLIQYLRMYTPMGEGDYNELYHLANCQCSKSSWKYIVGDRVLDSNSNKIELFDVMAYNKNKGMAYFLHVKKNIDASAYRVVCSQVQVCGEEIWQAVTSSSKNTIFEKFFDVATAEPKSVHRQFTKSEVESYIAPDKESFIECMLDNKLEFYVCVASCSKDYEDLDKVKNCQVNHSFTNSDFGDIKIDMMKILKEEGFVNADNSVTGKAFCTEKKFVEILQKNKNADIKKNTIEKVYHVIKKEIDSEVLYANSSFVAKASLIALHERFTYFLTMAARKKIQLKIIKIRDNSTNQDEKETGKGKASGDGSSSEGFKTLANLKNEPNKKQKTQPKISDHFKQIPNENH